MATAQRTPGLVSRFGGRDFALLWTGMTVSAFGTAVTTVALPLVALVTLDSSTFEVGVLSAAGVAAWLLFGLSAGVWVDRLPHRPLLVVCDVARAVALASVPIAYGLDALTFPHLVAVAFVVGVGSVFFDIGFQTYVPAVVESSALISANSRLQGSESVAQVGGPSLGGGLVQLLGGPATLVLDVVSYVVSAVSILGIRRSEPPADEEPAPTRMLSQIGEGLRYVARDRVLRPLTISAAVLNMFTVALETLAIVFLTRTLDVSAGLVGVLLATSGFGGVLGAVLAGAMSNRLGGARALRVAVVAGPLLVLLTPLGTRGAGLVLFAVGMVAIAAATVVFSVVARTYRQLTTPPNLLGRVTATIRFVSWGVLPFGALLAGTLGEAFGTRTALWVVCAAFLLTPIPVLGSPLRTGRDLPDAPMPPDGAPAPGPGAGPGAGPPPVEVDTPVEVPRAPIVTAGTPAGPGDGLATATIPDGADRAADERPPTDRTR